MILKRRLKMTGDKDKIKQREMEINGKKQFS